MGGDQGTATGLQVRIDGRCHQLLTGRIQVGYRLIEQPQLRPPQPQTCQRDAPLLPGRQMPHQFIGQRLQTGLLQGGL